MKIRTTLILLVVVATLLAACGGAAAPAAQTGDKFKVAVVMPSAINDVAFSQSMFQALKSLQAEMGGESQIRDQVFGEHVQSAGCARRPSATMRRRVSIW